MSLPTPPPQDDIRFNEFLFEIYRRFKDGIIIAGSSRVSESGGNVGLGQVNSPATITAAATNLLTIDTDEQVQRIDFGAGAGIYTYNIDLDLTDAFEGACFWLYISKAASANPTIRVRNGSGGANLISLNNGLAQNYSMMFIFDGTNWLKQSGILNDL